MLIKQFIFERSKTVFTIRIEAQKSGQTLPFADGQIAAIAMSQGLSLVTRNTKDFELIAGIRLINWFE